MLQNDSRKIKVGDTFIAIKGIKYDGHDYIVDAIKNNSWTNMDIFMDNFVQTYPQFSYVRAEYNKLKATNFNTVDAVVIAYGTNDWKMGRTLDNQSNELDTSTIIGSLRYGCYEFRYF